METEPVNPNSQPPQIDTQSLNFGFALGGLAMGYSGECPKPPLPRSESESGWLIEGDNVYWNGRTLDSSGFSPDSLEAIRFARREDADKVIRSLLRGMAPALKTTEHEWG